MIQYGKTISGSHPQVNIVNQKTGNFKNIFYCLYCSEYVQMSVSPHRCQKMVSHPPELELHDVMSYIMAAHGTEPRSSIRVVHPL